MPITEEFEWIFWFMGKIFEYVVYNFYCKIVLYWCFLTSVILKFHLKKSKFKKSLDQRSNYENSIFSKPGSLKELSGSVDVLWRWNGSKKLEKTEWSQKNCQAGSIFFDAQKTWENWKDSKHLSGSVDVLWRWNESKNLRKLKGV